MTATCHLQRDFWLTKAIKTVCFLYLGSKVGLSPRNCGRLMRPRPICKQTCFSRENEGLCLFSMRNRVDSLSFFPLWHHNVCYYQTNWDLSSHGFQGLLKTQAPTLHLSAVSVSPAPLKYISEYIRVSYEFLAAGFNMHRFCMK